MAEEKKVVTPDPDNVTDDGSDAGTSIEKFKTAEDRDRAYLELEKKTRTQDQTMAELQEKVDQLAALAASRQTPEDQLEKRGSDFADTYKSQDELKKFWERFASKPQEVFQELQEKTVQAVRNEMLARDAVNEFKREFPDLAKHEELVSIFVNKTDPKLSPRDRLRKAAPEARKYLAELARSGQGKEGDTLDSDAFVESPSGSRDVAPKSTPKPSTEQDELAEVIKEHSNTMFKKMQPPRARAS